MLTLSISCYCITKWKKKNKTAHICLLLCFLSLSSVYNLYWNNTFSMIRFAMECICVALKESNANYRRGQSFLTYLILFLQTYYAGESVFALLAYGRHSTIESWVCKLLQFWAWIFHFSNTSKEFFFSFFNVCRHRRCIEIVITISIIWIKSHSENCL